MEGEEEERGGNAVRCEVVPEGGEEVGAKIEQSLRELERGDSVCA